MPAIFKNSKFKSKNFKIKINPKFTQKKFKDLVKNTTKNNNTKNVKKVRVKLKASVRVRP
jgi:hypothetical protein